MNAELRVVSPIVPELHPELLRLMKQAWWATDRTQAQVTGILEGSTASAALVRPDGTVAACARALSDGVMLAMIYDVIVDERDRGRGLGRAVMEALLARPELDVRVVHLHCVADHEPFYASLGFTPNPHGVTLMVRKRP